MFSMLQLLGLILIAACVLLLAGAALGPIGYVAGSLGGAGLLALFVGLAGER